MSSNPDNLTEGMPWAQPLGIWRTRGASTTALRLGVGLPPLAVQKPDEPQIDQEGYSLWHYWASSPRPLDLWTPVKEKLLSSQRHHCSQRGEHPWHQLALRAQLPAMKAWAEDFELPLEQCKSSPQGALTDTLLLCAAWSGSDELVQWLLEQGVGEHSSDEQGLTPLMIAVHRCEAATIQRLLLEGADPEALDEKGRSALHHAAQCEQTDMYALLEDAGCDPEQPDAHGLTPLTILERTTRAAQQRDIQQLHWEMRYRSKLHF